MKTAKCKKGCIQDELIILDAVFFEAVSFTWIHLKNSDKINVQMHTKANNPKLYFNVIFVKADSFPVSPTAAVAITIDCGETSFAMTPPAVFAETNNDEFVPMMLPAVACIGANNVLLFTTDPVMNTPIHPNSGDNSGKICPVVATASPKTFVNPPYDINLAMPMIAQIMMIGIRNSKTVFFRRERPSLTLMAFVVAMVVSAANKIAVPVAPIKSMPIVIEDPRKYEFQDSRFKDTSLREQSFKGRKAPNQNK